MKKLLALILLCGIALGQSTQSTAPSSTGDITATGSTCGTTNACVSDHLPANASYATITITGTFVATLLVEKSADNGTTWATYASLSATGTTTYTVASLTDLRVRASAYTSGTATIVINTSTAAGVAPQTFAGAPSGTCAATDTAVNTTNGDFYSCNAGTWLKVNAAGGSGTVTNVATTSPVTGGPITGTGTIACATCTTSTTPGAGVAHFAGGTQAQTSSGIALADFVANLGTTTQVLHGNAAGQPTYGAVVNGDITNATIDLTAKVTGVLPTANGGDKGSIMPAYCTGTVGTASATEYNLAPFNPTGTNCTVTALGAEMPVPYACTVKNLTVKAGTAGSVVGSGIMKVYQNGSAAGGLTCTLGTGTTCSDATHTLTFAANDTYKITVTTGQASDATANIRASVQCQ